MMPVIRAGHSSRSHLQRVLVMRWFRRNPIGQNSAIGTLPQSARILRRKTSLPSIRPTPRLNGGLQTTRSAVIAPVMVRKFSPRFTSYPMVSHPRFANGASRRPSPQAGSSTVRASGNSLASSSHSHSGVGMSCRFGFLR